MNDSALGGLLLVAIGVGIAVLWYRGFFGSQITKATGNLAGAGTKQPFNLSLPVSGRAPYSGLGKTKTAV
jgi:hypothetical protein